jgi:hypothetical protein
LLDATKILRCAQNDKMSLSGGSAAATYTPKKIYSGAQFRHAAWLSAQKGTFISIYRLH